jgi:hypothetical protein
MQRGMCYGSQHPGARTDLGMDSMHVISPPKIPELLMPCSMRQAAPAG